MKAKKLVVSSNNKGKIREIKSILGGLNLEILTKDQAGLASLEVIEDKDTLEENAIKKAVEMHNITKGMVIADDSGLFVDYLDGAPGIYSARYAGVDGDDEANNKLLLEELEGVPEKERGAVFKTSIALVSEKGIVDIVVGECRGTIITEKRGKSGFGYDPLFIPKGYSKTFSELDYNIKNKISHRRDALEKLKQKLKSII